MKPSDPPIIKSGANRLVQVSQGSRDAKTVRHTVHSEEKVALKEHIVNPQEEPVREAARWQGAADAEPQSGEPPAHAWVQADALRDHHVLAPEETQAPAAHAKLFHESQQTASQGPVVLRQELGDQFASGDKAPLDAEHRIKIQTDGAKASNVAVPQTSHQDDGREAHDVHLAPAMVDHVLIDPAAASERLAGHLGERVQTEFGTQPTQEEPANRDLPTSEESQTSSASAPMASIQEPELPPELAANLAQQAHEPDVRESALQARLRAIKSNMSVTENRLSKLKSNAPDQ